MKTMTPEEVKQVIEQGMIYSIIDVRETEELLEGKIPGAMHIPLGELEVKLNMLDKNEKYIMVCRSGNRSGMASRFLEGCGYDVTNMDGGMMNWSGEVE